MNKIDDVFDYYMAKFRSHAQGQDKADIDGIRIGMYLTLAAVVNAAKMSAHVDAGYLYDLELSAKHAIDKAYEDEELNE